VQAKLLKRVHSLQKLLQVKQKELPKNERLRRTCRTRTRH